MFNDEPYQNAVLNRGERRRRPTPPAVTCNHCGFTYYEVSGGVHVCNEYRKGETMDHTYQITDYPKGARVEAIAPVSCHGGLIPTGTRGTVTAHCDDGRAWVFFDDWSAGHTFHEPEKFIRVACTHANEDKRCPANATEHEPAARGEGDGGWIVGRQGRYDALLDGYTVRAASGRLIAVTETAADANVIITEHNSHTALVEQRDRLLKALRQILKESEFVSDAKAPFSTWIAEMCRAALNEQKGGEGQ